VGHGSVLRHAHQHDRLPVQAPDRQDLKDRLVLKIPVINGIVEYAILERFCSILSTMLQAGVSMPGGAADHHRRHGQLGVPGATRHRPRPDARGWRVQRPLIDTELFPGAARQMFKVGEETGTLDQQLEVAALYFNRELESRIKRSRRCSSR
jgi:type IV pilus assembly protein PilC